MNKKIKTTQAGMNLLAPSNKVALGMDVAKTGYGMATGKADMVLSVEPLEAMRYRQFLCPNGWVVTSTTPFVNIPNYPETDALLDDLCGLDNIVMVDTARLARAAGNRRAQNMVCVGAASPLLDVIGTPTAVVLIVIDTLRADHVGAYGHAAARTPVMLARGEVGADTTGRYDYCTAYVNDLPAVVDLEAIRAAGPTIGVDPLPDEWPGEGPLGGIITALRAVDAEVVAVLACDLVGASAPGVRSTNALPSRAPSTSSAVPSRSSSWVPGPRRPMPIPATTSHAVSGSRS